MNNYEIDTGTFRISAQSAKVDGRHDGVVARFGEEMVVLTKRGHVDELREAYQRGAEAERSDVHGRLVAANWYSAACCLSDETGSDRTKRREERAAATYRYPTVRRRRTVKIEPDKLPNGSQSPLFLRVDDRGGLTYRYADDSGLFHSLAVALADRRSVVCADINVFIAEGAKLLAEPDEDVEG